MLIARGSYALMVDSDGATRFSDFDKLFSKVSKYKLLEFVDKIKIN